MPKRSLTNLGLACVEIFEQLAHARRACLAPAQPARRPCSSSFQGQRKGDDVTDVRLDPQSCESEGGDDAVFDCWWISEGDHVHAGQVLGQALLAQRVVDVQAPHDGVVEQILVPAGERFTPGHVLARVVEF
jgi:hypothetical protein